VQGFYFSWRIANDIRTGLTNAAENQQGLDDARFTWEQMANVRIEAGTWMSSTSH
jgi:hypothetical protein